MKTVTVSLLFFALLSISPATAQQAPARRESSVAQRLALTHEQRVKFRSIHHERKAQLDAVRADATLSPRARHQKNHEINAAAESRIRSILTPNQLDEYDQIQRERREHKVRRQETGTPETEPQPTPPPQ